jgi:membrane protein implicated in regulation of membrane protease activity
VSDDAHEGFFCAMRAASAAAVIMIMFAAAAAAASADDIRDIRGPKWVLPDWFVPAVIAAVVLLALGVFAVWQWRRRRRRPRVLLPFETALQRLEESRSLMQPASADQFSVAVSGIVRVYIEQQFEVIATLRTTEEFLRDLIESPNVSLAAHRKLLSEFLHQCDLAKFAGMALTLQSMESLHQSACAFVSETGQLAGMATNEPRDPLPAT